MSSELRFGFSTNAFREYALADAIGVIADAGYDGVELLFDEPHLYPTTATDTDLEAVQTALVDANVAISNCNAFMLTAIEDFHHPSYVEVDDDYRQQRIDYTADALRVAAALGQEYISIEPGGPIPDGKSREWALDRFVAALDELTPVARETGVDLLVEPEPDLLIETTEQFLTLVDRVETDVVGCNFDAGHLFCVDEDPAAQVERLAPYTRHYHLEDIPADRDHEHTQLGEGAMDIDSFLAAVADTDYDGYVTVELYPYQATAAETAQKAMAYLRDRGWA
jgi:sugar phosphate isomerase/epimerase